MKICVVEDNLDLLQNLRLLLQGEPQIQVRGAYSSAEEALEKNDWQSTTVLISDIDLPGLSGVELIREISRRYPAILSLAYTIYEDRPVVLSAIKAGACGYLVKGCTPRELVEAIHELYEGGAPMTPRIARKLVAEYHKQPEDTEENAITLTVREREVLRLIEKGLSYKQISERLGISKHTVHSHVKKIYDKFHASGRDETLQRARQLGIV